MSYINEGKFSGSLVVDGNTTTRGFDISTAYNIKVIVTDELDTSSEYVITLGTGTPALAIYDNKVSIGQKYDENLGGVFQVKGEVLEQGIRVSSAEPELREKVWIKKGKNLFKNSLIYGIGNCTNSNGTITQNTADTNQNPVRSPGHR